MARAVAAVEVKLKKDEPNNDDGPAVALVLTGV